MGGYYNILTQSLKHNYMYMDDYTDKVIEWAADRDLIHAENAERQLLKVMEEVGEIAQAVVKQKEGDAIPLEIGDAFVTLIILSQQMGHHPANCLSLAYDKISKRKGKTVDGIFIKK